MEGAMTKKLLIAVGVLVGLLVVAAAAAVVFIDANQFRPTLEDAMSRALGRKVTIANIRVALLSGGVALEGLSIADDPAYSREPFVTAKAVTAGVDLMPLIMSRSLRVESFRLEQPQVVLLRSASGEWNISSLGAASSRSGGNETSAAVSVFVQKLSIANGSVVVSSLTKDRAQHRYDNVNVDVSNLSLTSPFSFTATVETPGGGKAALDGQAGPINQQDATATPFQARLKVTHLDAAATGFVPPGAGVRGVVDFDGQLESSGTALTTKGTATATNVQLVPNGAPARVPVNVDYGSTYNLKTRRGSLTNGDVRLGDAAARLTGDYDAAGQTTTVRMRLVGQKMSVTALEAALPALGVTLPHGASLTKGTLDTDLAISGPVDRLLITGPLGLSNATLTGFDLSGKLGALASFAGLPKASDTIIQTLGGTFRVAHDGITASALELIVPAIGTLTGSGTIAPNNALDFKMLAKLQAPAAAPKAGGIAQVVAFEQRSGIPFKVGGTTSDPAFAPDLASTATNAKSSLVDAAKDPDTLGKAAQAIGSLFNRKKQ
jgi:AsmA protein